MVTALSERSDDWREFDRFRPRTDDNIAPQRRWVFQGNVAHALIK
jgi:hypothetical protein